MSRRMQKADPPALADENEGSNVKPGKAPIDNEEATEGISEETGEPPDSEKSEDPASDSDHISHPRPEEGEGEQRGGPGMGKSDDDDEDDWGGDEEEEGDAEKAENTEEEEGALTSEAKRERNDESIKSLTAGDLSKSLARLKRYADRGGSRSRKDGLLQKAQKGHDLSKSERAELFDLLGNKPQVRPPLAKSVTRGLRNNDGLQKALDVSEYLAEQHNELTKSLGVLSTHIERSDGRQHEFNLVLAKALADVGNLVTAMAEQMDAFGNQTVRAPKSKGLSGSAALQKSMAGNESQGDVLSKAQVLDAMEGVLVDNMQKGGTGILNGEDISTAITKYESFNQISPVMHQAVMQHVKGKAA